MEVIQMAHAGTMGLGQSTKAARSGNPWLVVAVMVAIVVATLGVWFATGSGLTTSSALTGRSAADDRIDTLRIAAGRGPLVDDSYNATKDTLGSNARRGPLVDDSYNATEDTLGGNARRGPLPDDSYNAIETLPGAVAAPVRPSSVVIGPGDYTFAQLQQMGAVSRPTSFAGNPAAAIVPGSVVSGGSAVVLPGAYSYLQVQQMHLGVTAPTISATSGTFHVGNPQATDPIAPLQGIKTIDNPAKRDRVGGP
jgi:hypothetical protein